MKGIDTNVLARYILQDDEIQSHQATQFIEQECSPTTPAFINGIVLCELVWILETAYGYLKADIAQVLSHILRTRQFYIHQAEILWQALRGYEKDGLDFADHYIGQLNTHYECDYTLTFDKKAARLKHFKLILASNL